MRKKLYVAAVFTALVLSACGDQAGEGNENSAGSSVPVNAAGTSKLADGAPEGFIELCYTEFFGVCGTELKLEKVTLAGDEASIGTYDNGDHWDFVSFRGANEGIVALSCAVEDWWPEYETQVLEILDTVSLNTVSAIACGTNLEPPVKPKEDSVIEELGLSLEMKEYTNTGARETL